MEQDFMKPYLVPGPAGLGVYGNQFDSGKRI